LLSERKAPFSGRVEGDGRILMSAGDRWYKNAVIYALDAEAFADADGDGIGDFQGLIDRLDYLSRLGVTCVWLLPFYPTPNRDNGYDVMDYYGVDPRLGTLGDFVEFVHGAEERGIRVIVDLVVNHTSDQHPWFQAARRDPDSKYRDYYVWAEEPPELPEHVGPVFPGEEESVWTWDDEAGAYYYHRFYHFQPDLNLANPEVREEIRKIMGFWLELGVSGFRVDAATLMIQRKGDAEDHPEEPHEILREMRRFVNTRRGDAVLLAEADDEPGELATYFGDGDEMNLLMNFVLDAHMVLALATRRSEPLEDVFERLPPVPEEGQWANFLRNYDELNIGRLSRDKQQLVYEAFAPDPDMRIYDRGIRRRLAPMLDGDRDRLELAFSLLFSMPGTPMFVYGDELGMGDDLSLPGRNPVRTPMQWSPAENAGFSTADAADLVRPVIDEGPFGYERVNVADQHDDPESLLSWMERLVGTRREMPVFGWGDLTVLETGHPTAFAHRCEWREGSAVAVHNLAADGCEVALGGVEPDAALTRVFGEATANQASDGWRVGLGRFGYGWFRVDGVHGGESSR
jgi:maltose alpha-D-glucosyltransferase/alpha-amylase